jgi:uncharacterized protein YkwD
MMACAPSGGNEVRPAAAAELAHEAFNRVNSIRAAHGLAPLAWHHTATGVALEHAREMSAFDYLDHVDLDGAGPGQRLAEAGLVPYGWGENIGRAASAADVVAAWMDSPEHRANILTPGFTHVGTGVSENYWTQVFLIVN